MKGQTRIGIGGWSYPPWRGTFYPEKLPQSRELEYASRRLGAIEINATFYGRQSPASWEKWAAAVPDGFQFAIKGSRYCVTRPRLADAGEGVQKFLDQGLSALGDRLGPVLWMLAPRRKFDAKDIARFIDLLPRELAGRPLRHAIEPRDESFRDEQFYALCRNGNVAVVFDDHDEYPCIDVRTADFSYARLQRMRETVQSGYDEAEMEEIARRAESLRSAGLASYIFMINGAKVRAPAAAIALQNRLGIAPA